MSLLSPLAGPISAGTIDVFAKIQKMLYRLGKVLRGDVPYPLRSVANHHLKFGIFKISPRRFALDATGEHRDHFVSFQGARRFNCSTIADRPRIAVARLSESRLSAFHSATIFTSRFLPGRPAAWHLRTGMPVPSMHRYRVLAGDRRMQFQIA